MKPNFDKYSDKLVPAIIQDANTNKVLMLGYMNSEAYDRTLTDKKVVFYSRSKERLWMKGETSGNFLQVVEILNDCDNDCLLIKVNPAGNVCHTGIDTCFNEINESSYFIGTLEKIIEQRKHNNVEGSYTSGLFKTGINKIAQKLGEEAVELIIEAKDNNEILFKNEAADLVFHFLILLQAKNLKLPDIAKVLQDRNS